MAQPNGAFEAEGKLLDLWNEAVQEFSKSTIAQTYQLEAHAEHVPNPAKWLQDFQDKRHDKSSRASKAREKVGKHLMIIQDFVRCVGFCADVASCVFPAATPASLVVNAFAWLFGSFTRISSQFDRIESFFEVVATRLKGLEAIGKHLGKQDSQTLREHIVNMFICCLDICRIASEQAGHRLKTWGQYLTGDDALGDALQNFTKIDEALLFQVEMETYGTSMEIKDRIHDKIRKQVPTIKQSGQWLLNSEPFRSWKEQDVNRLWYTGKIGAGKSVMASIIIEHLEDWATTPSQQGKVMLAYLYMSYTSKPNIEEFLGSIFRQFQIGIRSHPKIVDKFGEYRRGGRYGNQVRRLSRDDIMLMLSEISKDKTVFVVVDALDELDIVSDSNSRSILLESLQKIQPNIKILVTSRNLEHLKTLQAGFRKEEFEAHDDDMDKYIDFKIKSCDFLQDFPDDYHQEIRSQVKRNSGKMFIIVQLHMAALCEVDIKADLEELLQKLPSTIDGAYKITMNRIKNNKPTKAAWATSTLGWVAYARRLLSLSELQHALAAQQNPDDTEGKYLRNKDDIIAASCGLLIMDVDNTVRHVHKSAREFFDSGIRDDKFLTNFDKDIAMACTKQLCRLSRLSSLGTSLSHHRSLANLLNDFPLTKYAGQYLHIHHRLIRDVNRDEETRKAIYSLLSDDRSRELYSWLLAKFDAYDSTRTLMDEDEDDRRAISRQLPKETTSTEHLKPLHLAVYLGDAKVVGRLIQEGADVNELDPYGQSALIVAIKAGLDSMAGILLENGAQIDLATIRGHYILLYAMERDYKTVKHIIGKATDDVADERLLEILGILCMVVLSLLHVLGGLVKGLLARPRLTEPTLATPNTSSLVPTHASTLGLDRSLERYRSLLYQAYEGNVDAVLALLEPRLLEPINLELVSQEAESPNAEWNVRRFRSNRYSYFESSLDYSESSSSPESTSAEDADEVTSGNEDSHEHSDSGGQEIDSRHDILDEIDEIIATHSRSRGGINEPSSDTYPPPELDAIKTAFLQSACFLAAERQKHKVVEIFLDRGVSPNLKNFQGQSLLHRATARNDGRLVKLLLDKGANVDQRDSNGRTPLMANADLKRERVLRLLIDGGAKCDLTQREGSHEMYEAAVFGATAVVELYLENGTDASIANNFGWTPLHGAAANGHLDCVQLLLNKGADVNAISDTGMTPFDFVDQGQKHYDHILTGGKHYAAEVIRGKELSKEDKNENKNQIWELLDRKNAMTSNQMQILKENEYFEQRTSHRSWQHDSWWDKTGRPMPWYTYND